MPRRLQPGLLVVACTLAVVAFCPKSHADPTLELSGAAGFGMLAAGVSSGRFAISPSASFSVRGERMFFVARDTISFLGATGGRFGIHNEITLGGGVFWELVNVSAGISPHAPARKLDRLSPPGEARDRVQHGRPE